MVSSPYQMEDVARMAMGDLDGGDPLPPAPNYGPFGYFRLALLIFAAMVAAVFLVELFR